MKAMSWRERADRLPHVGPDFAIASANAALVVVDMQYMFADRDYGVGRLLETYPESGRYYFDNVDARVVPNNQRLIELFRKHDLPIVWLAAAGRHPGAWDCCRLISGRDPKMQSDSGLVTTGFFHRSKDSHIVEAVAPRDDEILILKQSYGAFNSTGIDSTAPQSGGRHGLRDRAWSPTAASRRRQPEPRTAATRPPSSRTPAPPSTRPDTKPP